MKTLILSLIVLASSVAYSQSNACNVSVGYSCSEDIFFAGKFSRNVMCFAYGEETVEIDADEQAKIFASKESCESISATESECHIVRTYSEKFCAETGGEYSYSTSECMRCKQQ